MRLGGEEGDVVMIRWVCLSRAFGVVGFTWPHGLLSY